MMFVYIIINLMFLKMSILKEHYKKYVLDYIYLLEMILLKKYKVKL